MSLEIARDIIKDASLSLGVPGVVLGPEGVAFSEKGLDGMTWGVGYNANRGTIDFIGMLSSEIPTQEDLETMLVGNYQWQKTLGATLALDPTEKVPVILRNTPFKGVTASELADFMREFFAACRRWSFPLVSPLVDEYGGGHYGGDDDDSPLPISARRL